MSRIRIQAPIDDDSVSPESVSAALTYIAGLIGQRAEAMGVALDWNSFKIYTRRSKRKKALLVTGWAKIL